MNFMKFRLLAVITLLVAVALAGCRPERLAKSGNPRTMAFSQAGVALTVGDEWQCQNVNTEKRLFPPTLLSDLGSIRVVLLPADRSNPEQVADGLRNDFDINPRVAKHSFRKQQFASDNGVRGLCVSYLEQSGSGDNATAVENAHYLVKNKAGRCVVINFVAAADGVDTSAVHRMLRTSLALQ